MAKRVLLAEDEPNIVESLIFLLERAGFDVASEMNGQAALDAALADQPLRHRKARDRALILPLAGLGLPISRAIMRTMSGDLSVEFAPDDTSVFRLVLARPV